MGWRELLQKPGERVVLPWLYGRSLRSHDQLWTILGPLPPEEGWYTFELWGREAELVGPAEPKPEILVWPQSGYLVGNRFLADGVGVLSLNLEHLPHCGERVHLVEAGLDRFARITTGLVHEIMPRIYIAQAMPLGPEEEVLQAYLDGQESVAGIKGVTPALDLSFRVEVFHRKEVEKRRAEAEKRRREEEERLAREARRKELAEKLGDGAGRRAMAAVDFEEAARAALAVGGAELLDTRKGQRGERVVRYRLDRQRYECVCNERTLQIIDSGICLTDHDTGEKGDTYFTLESLPSVVRQANNGGRLVVYRHV